MNRNDTIQLDELPNGFVLKRTRGGGLDLSCTRCTSGHWHVASRMSAAMRIALIESIARVHDARWHVTIGAAR